MMNEKSILTISDILEPMEVVSEHFENFFSLRILWEVLGSLGQTMEDSLFGECNAQFEQFIS